MESLIIQEVVDNNGIRRKVDFEVEAKRVLKVYRSLFDLIELNKKIKKKKKVEERM